MITWTTPAGSLGIITERVVQNISLQATSNTGTVTYSLLAGALPRGLRLESNRITGSAVEVKQFTESKFVIRASDGSDLEDRTFRIGVDGSDEPQWVTQEGFLQVGENNDYFVLDNARVNFQLDATDTDLTAGDVLEYYLVPNGGELPPGLSLSRTGLISGFTDPIFALEYNGSIYGGYDTAPLDITPIDFVEARSNGYDTFFYDNVDYDYNEPSRIPRRLSRIYNFIVAVTDGVNVVNRLFKMYVVTEEFLQADNSLLQVDTNLFRASSTGDRKPIWITERDLGRIRANNYVTIFLDVYDPPTLSGTITYLKVPNNPDGSASTYPPGLELDSMTGELAGTVPYQSAVTKQYQFTMVAVNFPAILASQTYTLVGDWSAAITYQVNQAVRFQGFVFNCIQVNTGKIPTENPDFWFQGANSADKTFTVDIIGEIESAISWISHSDRGTIKPNQPSLIKVEAESLLYGNSVYYELVSGDLPPGLEFLPNGLIQGKVKQFADDQGPGLTRLYEGDSSLEDSTGSKNYDVTFDGDTTSFDKKFTFTVKASDSARFAESEREFFITIIAENEKTFANIYMTALQSKDKRLEWYNFITDASIFKPEDIYRYGDENFGIQTDLRVLVFAGIESLEAVKYVQAMSRNHYRKRLLFGDLKVAVAKDPDTQQTLYEVIYVDVVDDLEKNNKSISQTIELDSRINSKVLVSYDAIKVDSDIPFVSDEDHQRVFPNSIKNMRSRIRSAGTRDRDFLPLWMRSIQSTAQFELGYTKALVLCFCNPGKSQDILTRIKGKTNFASRGEWNNIDGYIIGDSVIYKGIYYTCISNNVNKDPEIFTDFWLKNFDFKQIDFVADRYLIDIIDGQIEDKYLAFPQRGEKLP